MEESFLTEYVRKDIEALGYTTYAEVQSGLGMGKNRCDMYARNEDPNSKDYGRTIAFEAKLSFNLKVLEQAYHWKTRSHETYIIVPAISKNIKSRKFAREVCKSMGIGVMEVNMKTERYNITVTCPHFENPKLPALYDEQKYVIASNADNNYMTPFKVTVKNINQYFKEKNVEREYIITLIKNIKHHYKTEVSAVRTIKFLIQKQVIKGFYITKENSKIVVMKDHGF